MAALLAPAGGAQAQQQADLPVVTLGVVIDGPWARNDEISALVANEVVALTRLDYDVSFPADKRLISDWTVEGVRRDLDRLLADPEVDVVLAMGVLGSNEAIQRRDLPKPVIAPFVVNYEFQGAPFETAADDRLVSGVPNLSYLTTPWEAGRDLEELYRVAPFTKVAVFVDARLIAGSGAIVEAISTTAARYDVGYQVIPVLDSARPALAAIDPDVDAAMVSALLNMPEAETAALIDGINERRLPSMALFGRDQVVRGLLFGVAPDTNFTRVARRVAIHTQAILMGEPAGSLPIQVAQPRELVMNMATARRIGFSPTWDVLTQAELLNQRDTTVATLTLLEAVSQALQSNLDYLASARRVAAQQEAVREAEATLLPSLDAGLTALSIDPTRAGQSLGQQAQHSLSGSLVLSQPLYIDAAWAGSNIQQSVLEAAGYERETLRLDIVRAASVGYLNVLIALTLEQIQQQNVALSRTNLELATSRQAVGVASRAEVFRWQSEIASDRSAVIEASVRRNLAEIDLNRIRNRPLEDPFRTVSSIEESEFRQPMLDLLPYINDPDSFKIFRRFMVQEGLRDAPELEAIDSAIDAQLRALTGTERDFWLPDLGFQANLGHLFADGGAGDSGSSALGDVFPTLFAPPRTTWGFAVNAGYNVYRGGSRYAERERARQELELLRLQRRATAERLEQRIRADLHRMVGSYAQIDLAEEAADAATRNLELVQDSYSQGVVNIVDLIDAQNAALTASLARANAVYEFMINLTNVGRSISNFDFVSADDPAARQAWLERVRAFFESVRGSGGADAR